MNTTQVRIFYPTDPLGAAQHGVDAFIRGMIRFSPQDIRFSVVGTTTDTQARPVGRFRTCSIGDREFDFFPALHVQDPSRRGHVPLSARYTLATSRARAQVSGGFDVFDFHRIEPSLLFSKDARPKNAFFHEDPEALHTRQTDALWKRAPLAYDAVEAQLVPHLSSVWSLQASGLTTLRERYPEQSAAFRLARPWIDTSTFSPPDAVRRRLLVEQLGTKLALDPAATRIVMAGRLEEHKDPMLLLDAMSLLMDDGRKLVLLVVGDGELRRAMEARARSCGIEAHVRFLGLQSHEELADILCGSDLLATSSIRESMPRPVLEALACGLPVACSNIGEARNVVVTGVNGAVARHHTLAGYTDALENVLDHLDEYTGRPAIDAAAPFSPSVALAPIYENFRELADRERTRIAITRPLTAVRCEPPIDAQVRVEERMAPSPLAVLAESLRRHAPVPPPSASPPPGDVPTLTDEVPTSVAKAPEQPASGHEAKVARAVAGAAAAISAASATAAEATRAPQTPVRTALSPLHPLPLAPVNTSTIVDWSRDIGSELMAELVLRVDSNLPVERSRVVGFIASGSGEGTSTLAASYARAAALRVHRRVLLLSMFGHASRLHGVFELMARGHDMHKGISRKTGNVFKGALLGSAADAAAGALCQRPELWDALRDAFDEIVIDMPSSAASRLGVSAAPFCDGVIVILEAEKTRAPVVEALVSSLYGVGANVLGSVLNKRRYHVPELVYKRL